MSNYQTFTAAKGIFRIHSGWTDEQVADELNIPHRDRSAMQAIAEARKDVLAGDIPTPHVQGAGAERVDPPQPRKR